MNQIEGKVFIFGDNIDTDQIYPGRYLELTEPQDIAAHVMEGADATFPSKVSPGAIIVAGKNFGCGSSREHAVITLLAAGVRAVVARSFARIFYRNAINRGLCVVEIPELDLSKVKDGHEAVMTSKMVLWPFLMDANLSLCLFRTYLGDLKGRRRYFPL